MARKRQPTPLSARRLQGVDTKGWAEIARHEALSLPVIRAVYPNPLVEGIRRVRRVLRLRPHRLQVVERSKTRTRERVLICTLVS